MGKGDGVKSVNERLIKLEQEVSRLTNEIKRLHINKKIKERNNNTTIEIGDQVISKQAPYHNGTVKSFSKTKYWVWIQTDNGLKRKALSNVKIA